MHAAALRRHPDLISTKARLREIMNDLWCLATDKVYASLASFSIAGATLWAYFAENPAPVKVVGGGIVGLATMASIVWGFYVQGRLSRIKLETERAQNRATQAEADRKANDQRIAIEAANANARRAEERAQELHDESSFKAKIEANAAKIGELQTEVAQIPVLKSEIAALRLERSTLYRDLHAELLNDLAEGGVFIRPSGGWPILPVPEEASPPDPASLLLVVEDNEHMGRALGKVFRTFGWVAEVVRTLAEAKRRLEQSPPPACIVLDLMLPDGRGEDLLRYIRQKPFAIRVVVCTAAVDEAIVGPAKALNPDAFVPKPATIEALLAAVGRPAKAMGTVAP